MTRTRLPKPPRRTGRSGGAARTGAELFGGEGYYEARMLASAMGLPRVCHVRKCRRRKRCFGFGIVCLDEHAGLAKKRFGAALALLGWEDCLEAENDEDDDDED